MRILYDNHVFDATIDSLTENPDVTFDIGLNDTRLSRKGRTLAVTGQWIKFTFTSAVSASYFAILSTNLTSSATVTIEANTTDSFVTPPFSETVTNYDGCWIANFTETSYQYWRVTIEDATNTDGYIEIGYAFLGTFLTMPGMNPGHILPKKTNSVSQKSISGQLYGDVRLKFRAAEIGFQDVSQTEKDNIDTFFEVVDVVRPFIMLIWESDLDVEAPLYCNLTDEFRWKGLGVGSH